MDIYTIKANAGTASSSAGILPFASKYINGAVSILPQTFSGLKTFADGIITNTFTANTFIVNNIVATSISLPSLSPNSVLLTDASSNIIAQPVLEVSKGGTNSNIALTNGKIMVSSGGSIMEGTSFSNPMFNSVNVSSLTPSMIVFTDASNNLVSGSIGSITIDLTSQVYNTLPIANGGTNSNVALTNNKLMVSVAGKIVEGTDSVDPIFNSLTSMTFVAASDLNSNTLTVASTATFTSLNASLPVQTNASFELISAAINLSTSQVTGILPVANGGTNSNTALTNGRLMQSVGGAIVEGTSSSNPTFTGITSTTLTATDTLNVTSNINVAYLTPSMLVFTDASNNLVSGSVGLITIDLTTQVYNILPIANGGTNSGTALLNDRLMRSSSGAIVEAPALTNGQLFIGSTGAFPVASAITGTANQVLVTNGAGSITLSTPQNINVTSSPTFSDLTLSALTPSFPVQTNGANLLVSAAINLNSQVTGVLPIGNGGTNSNVALTNGKIMISTAGSIIEGTDSSDPTFNSLTSTTFVAASDLNSNTLTVLSTVTLTSLSASLPVQTNASSELISAAINLSTSQVTGILPINRGGTNSNTALTNGRLMTSVAGAIVEGTSSSNPTFNSLTSTTLTTTDTLNITSNINVAYLTPSMLVFTDASNNLVSGSVGSITIDLTTQVTGILPVANGGTNSGAALANNRLIRSTAGAIVEAVALTDGQLFIGSTGNFPAAASLTGTANQISVTAGAGSITLSLPQNIDIAATPTFSSETLSSTSNQLVLGTTNTITINSVAPSASRTYTLPDTGANSNFVMTDGIQTINGNKTLSGTINLSALTASTPLQLDGSNNIITSNINLTTQASGVLSIANGGTNSSFALVNGSLMISDAGKIVEGTSSSDPIFNSVTSITFVAADNLSSNTATILTSVTLPFLSVSLPVQTNALNQLISAAINLSSVQVTGILPVARGGTNSTTALTNGKLMNSVGGSIIEGTSSSDPTFNSLTSTTFVAASDLNSNTITVASTVTFTSLSASLPVQTNASLELISAAISLASGQVSGILPIGNGGTNSNTALANNRLIRSNAGAIVEAVALTNGQLFIGSTGNFPTASSISGSADQVIVTNGAGSITLSLPQDINVTSAPTFTAISLTDTSNQVVLGSTNTITINAVAPAASIVYTIPDSLTNASFVMTEGIQTINGNKTLTGTINLPSLTPSLPLQLDASGNVYAAAITFSEIVGILPIANGGTNSGSALNNNRIIRSSAGQIVEAAALTNGQLFIGSTGSFPSAASLTGTSNQIIIANGVGSITLSLPQDIAITSSPTFSDLTLSALSPSLPVQTNGANLLISAAINLSTSQVTGILPIANGGTNSSTALSNNRLIRSLGGAIVEATALTNGQLFIGSTGNFPSAASLTGTADQVSVTVGAGSITLSLPQDLAIASIPTFAAMILTDINNQLVLGTTNTVTINSVAPAASRTYTLPDTGANSNFLMSDGAQTINGTITLSSLTASLPLQLNAGKEIISAAINLSSSQTTGTLTINKGGTNSNTALTNGKLMNSVAGSIVEGTSSSDPTFNSLTSTTFVAASDLNSNTITVASTATFTSLSASLPVQTNASFELISAAISLSSAQVTGTLPIANGGTNSNTALSNNRLIRSTAGAIVEAVALTNGQLFIGATGAFPTAASIAGTLSQVIVTNGVGSITLSLPQNIATTSTPTFASETLTAVTNQLVLGTTNTTTISATAPAASRTYTLPDTGANSNFVMTDGSQTINGNKTITGTTNLNSLTASLPLQLDASKNIISLAISLSTSVSGVLPIANGGTNSNTALTNGKLMVSLGNQIVEGTSSSDPIFNSVTSTTFVAADNLTSNTLNVLTSATMSFLTASLPVQTNGLNQLISSAINLASAQVTGILPIANGGTNSTSALNNNRLMRSTAGSIVEAVALTDGQLFIGSTGNFPTAATITGASGQIGVTNGSGSIILTNTQNMSIISTSLTANNTAATTAAYFAWQNSSYSTFTTATVIFWVVQTNRNVTVGVFDGTTTLGSVTPVGALTGIGTFTFTLPTSDVNLQFRLNKSAAGGTNPVVTGITLKLS